MTSKRTYAETGTPDTYVFGPQSKQKIDYDLIENDTMDDTRPIPNHPKPAKYRPYHKTNQKKKVNKNNSMYCWKI